MNKRHFADTNLFLRYLTNDIPEQASAIDDLLVKAAKGKLALVTNALVLAEIVWTLESFYKQAKVDIRDKLLAILNTPGLEVSDNELVMQAALWYVDKNVDFIDAFNAAWMLEQGIEEVFSFDRKHFDRFESLAVSVPGEHPPTIHP